MGGLRRRWMALLPVLAATLGCLLLRAIASREPPLSRLTLMPRESDPGEGREAPPPSALSEILDHGRREPLVLEDRTVAPGEMEVLVFAPEAAQKVTLLTPGRESLVARYEPERGLWTSRFLIDRGVEGPFSTRVEIQSKDGRTEFLDLSCTVSRHAGVADLVLRRSSRRPTDLEITARPRSVSTAQARVGGAPLALLRPCYRAIEVVTPRGQRVFLKRTTSGLFRGHFPAGEAGGSVALHVVALDRALNEREDDVTVPLAVP